MEGICLRCVQYASTAKQLQISLLELRLEVLISNAPDSCFLDDWRRSSQKFMSNGFVIECLVIKALQKAGP